MSVVDATWHTVDCCLTILWDILLTRRGAINTVQLNYLESYKPMRKRGDKKCTIM